MKCQNQTSNLFQFKTNLSLFMCVLFFSSFVCISAYVNVYFKTTIIKQNIIIILIAGVPSSQALLGYLITAPPSVCVPDVLGVVAVWIQNQTKKGKKKDAVNHSLRVADHTNMRAESSRLPLNGPST